MHKIKLTSILSGVAVALSLILPINSAQAACVQTKATGKTVGQINVGSLTMPIKPFTYPAGGIMEPQKSVLMAAISLRHQPLTATMGTSVVVWHVNYAGCVNPLNVLTTKNVGYKFQVQDSDGGVISYKITSIYKVKKGNYKQSWFNVIGPRQLLLATCGGNFANGHYQENVVIIAKPTVQS
jgi:Sortase domain